MESKCINMIFKALHDLAHTYLSHCLMPSVSKLYSLTILVSSGEYTKFVSTSGPLPLQYVPSAWKALALDLPSHGQLLVIIHILAQMSLYQRGLASQPFLKAT